MFYLIISFMEDQYAFYVLRAISALLAVLTIPSSINMISESTKRTQFFATITNMVPRTVQMYPDPVEQAKKLALFGLAGALVRLLSSLTL